MRPLYPHTTRRDYSIAVAVHSILEEAALAADSTSPVDPVVDHSILPVAEEVHIRLDPVVASHNILVVLVGRRVVVGPNRLAVCCRFGRAIDRDLDWSIGLDSSRVLVSERVVGRREARSKGLRLGGRAVGKRDPVRLLVYC